MKRRRQSNSRHDFRQFEERICLTVSAAVNDMGSLHVRGDADGPVEIVATGEGAFDITDDGSLVASVDGVTKNIIVFLDGAGNGNNGSSDAAASASNDHVSIQLNDQDVDNVLVRLGHGDNRFDIAGDEAIDRVLYFGGEDADEVNLGVDTDFMALALTGAGDDAINLLADANRARFRMGLGNDTATLRQSSSATRVAVGLGAGDDTLQVNGDVTEGLFVRGEQGNDEIGIGADASIGSRLNIRLGNGDNSVGIAGNVGGHLNIVGGSGADQVVMNPGSDIGGTARMMLGGGDNSVGIRGSLTGSLFVRGGQGNDQVNITDAATIDGNVGILLGAGDNSFAHEGSIDGNLTVLSFNPDDVFTANGFVGGETRLGPGQQGGGGGGDA